MSALLSLIVQVAAAAAGIYIGVTRSWAAGVGLIFFSQLLHWAAERLSTGLMALHQRTLMTPEDRSALRQAAIFQASPDHLPRAWRRIATATGWLYVLACAALIWSYLTA